LADALTVPHAVAALVLCVAGVVKLRAPGAAARAVSVSPALVRVFAVSEIALGAWALLKPTAGGSAAMAAYYAGFAALTAVLWRRGAACGCFGSERAPASPIQSALSATLALVCAVGAAASPHTASWIFRQPAGTTAVLVVGTAAAVWGIVLAYSELPVLWRAWSPV
jgi:hypothetical protein